MPDLAGQARVLYVDDDRNLLQAVRRQQRKYFEMTISEDPHEALEILEREGPFSVVVADLNMPGIDGIELLKRVREQYPDTVRIMLTGNADLESAKRAVNVGDLYRFLTKPCPYEDLRQAIREGIRHHDRVVAERDLLERTLFGAVKVLTETLGLVNPAAFGRASRVAGWVRRMVAQLGFEEAWKFDLAAMLCQIGCVAVPSVVVEKASAGKPLEEHEQEMIRSHPAVGQQLIRAIPRLEEVAEMIRLQNARFDGTGEAFGGPNGEAIPLGARLLKVALDYDALTRRGVEGPAALEEMSSRPGAYDAEVLAALEVVHDLTGQYRAADLAIEALCEGMILSENLYGDSGMLLVAAGQRVTVPMVQRLQNWITSGIHVIDGPVRVLVPVEETA